MNHKIYFYDTKQKNRLQRFTEILKENPLNDIQTRIVNHKIYRTIRDQLYLQNDISRSLDHSSSLFFSLLSHST